MNNKQSAKAQGSLRKKAQGPFSKIILFEPRKKQHPTRDQSMAAVRVAQLNRVYWENYPDKVLPNNRLGRKWCRIMVRTMAFLPTDRRPDWLKKHAPWLTSAERTRLVMLSPLWYRSNTLGQWFELDYDTRARLKAWTIAPYDKTDEELAMLTKEKDRERKDADSRKWGRKPHSETLAQTKPWKALGMSRRTWYRRGKPAGTDFSEPLADTVAQKFPRPTLIESLEKFVPGSDESTKPQTRSEPQRSVGEPAGKPLGETAHLTVIPALAHLIRQAPSPRHHQPNAPWRAKGAIGVARWQRQRRAARYFSELH